MGSVPLLPNTGFQINVNLELAVAIFDRVGFSILILGGTSRMGDLRMQRRSETSSRDSKGSESTFGHAFIVSAT
jgi:hypothetical protein